MSDFFGKVCGTDDEEYTTNGKYKNGHQKFKDEFAKLNFTPEEALNAWLDSAKGSITSSQQNALDSLHLIMKEPADYVDMATMFVFPFLADPRAPQYRAFIKKMGEVADHNEKLQNDESSKAGFGPAQRAQTWKACAAKMSPGSHHMVLLAKDAKAESFNVGKHVMLAEVSQDEHDRFLEEHFEPDAVAGASFLDSQSTDTHRAVMAEHIATGMAVDLMRSHVTRMERAKKEREALPAFETNLSKMRPVSAGAVASSSNGEHMRRVLTSACEGHEDFTDKTKLNALADALQGVQGDAIVAGRIPQSAVEARIARLRGVTSVPAGVSPGQQKMTLLHSDAEDSRANPVISLGQLADGLKKQGLGQLDAETVGAALRGATAETLKSFGLGEVSAYNEKGAAAGKDFTVHEFVVGSGMPGPSRTGILTVGGGGKVRASTEMTGTLHGGSNIVFGAARTLDRPDGSKVEVKPGDRLSTQVFVHKVGDDATLLVANPNEVVPASTGAATYAWGSSVVLPDGKKASMVSVDSSQQQQGVNMRRIMHAIAHE